MVDLRKWRHAVALADAGTFARASRALRLTQPALTRSIQALEAALGLVIFERQTGGVHVTPAGQELLNHARFLLNQAARMRQHAEGLRTGECGKVALGVTPMLAPLLIDFVQTWASQGWGADLDMHIQPVPRLTELLLNDNIDFFVGDTRRARWTEGLIVTDLALMHVGYYVRAGHPLLALPQVMPEDLLRFPQAAPEFREDANIVQVRHSHSRITCEDVQTLKAATLAGDVILLGMGPGLEPELSQGRIVRLSVPLAAAMTSNVGIVTLTRSRSAVLDRVMDSIATLLTEKCGQETASKASQKVPQLS